MSGLRAVLRLPAFRALWCSYAINRTGDVLGALALAVIVLSLTGSALATAALFLATQFLPGLCGPWLAGRLEPFSAGRALALLYGLEAGILFLLAVVAGHSGAPVIIGLAFADAVLAFCARALTRAQAASAVVEAGLLAEGKAAFNLALATATVAGPLAAGVILATSGAPLALALDGGSFLVAAAIIAREPRLRFPAAPPASARAPGHVRAGLSYIASQPKLRALVFGEGIAFGFFYLVVPVTVVFAGRSLHAGTAGYAALLTSWGAGIAIGAVAQVALTRRVGEAMVLISTGVVGAGYIGTALAPTLAVACAASVLGGIGNGTQWASVETAVHELVEEAFRVRVAAVLEAMAAIAPGAGILAGGTLAALLSPRAAYLTAGLGLMVLVGLGLLARATTGAAADVQHPSSLLTPEPVRVVN